MQLDEVAVGFEPVLACVIQPMRGSVVDDKKYLSPPIGRHKLPKKLKEGGAVEDGSKAIVKIRSVEIHGAKYVGSLALTVGVYTRLLSYPRPCLVQRAVEPEACLVLEQDYPAACPRFFFIAGNLFVTQISCFSASARANLLRGR